MATPSPRVSIISRAQGWQTAAWTRRGARHTCAPAEVCLLNFSPTCPSSSTPSHGTPHPSPVQQAARGPSGPAVVHSARPEKAARRWATASRLLGFPSWRRWAWCDPSDATSSRLGSSGGPPRTSPASSKLAYPHDLPSSDLLDLGSQFSGTVGDVGGSPWSLSSLRIREGGVRPRRLLASRWWRPGRHPDTPTCLRKSGG
jgi:hypothetical protein